MMGNVLLHTCSEVTFNKTYLLMALLTNQLTRNTRQAVTSEWVIILEYPSGKTPTHFVHVLSLVSCFMRIAEQILDLFIL